jgi:hypothetical protein
MKYTLLPQVSEYTKESPATTINVEMTVEEAQWLKFILTSDYSREFYEERDFRICDQVVNGLPTFMEMAAFWRAYHSK